MKIRLERSDTALEVEKEPMPEGRFRALCAVAVAGVYAGLAIGIAALCGIWGVVVVLGTTVILAMIAGGSLI